MIRYRVSWSASTNITFEDYGDWFEFDGTQAECEAYVYGNAAGGQGERLSPGLEEALDQCGFEWSLEFEHIVNAEHPKHSKNRT